MNTQKKEPELGDGVTSAEYWMYDGKLGRRWNVDPVFYPSISLYCSFSNNPIYLIDLNGASFDPANKIKADEIRLEAEKKKTNASERISELGQNKLDLQSKLNNALIINNSEDIKKLHSEIEGIKSEIDYLDNQILAANKTIANLDALEKDAVSVFFEEIDFSPLESTKHGGTEYQFKEPIPSVRIFYDNTETIVHELAHAVDFLNGKIMATALKSEDKWKYGSILFLDDEVEAELTSYYWSDFGTSSRIYELDQINLTYFSLTISYNHLSPRFEVKTAGDLFKKMNRNLYESFSWEKKIALNDIPYTDLLDGKTSILWTDGKSKLYFYNR
jgi:hypothetical protein